MRVDMRYAGGVLAVVAFCGGCMKDTAQLRVDAISRWQAVHSEEVRVLVDAHAEASLASARKHIRRSLMTTKLELENQLRETALKSLAACGMNVEAGSHCVQQAKADVQEIEEQIPRTQADRMNRVGDRAEEFQLVHAFRNAQGRYWEAVSRHHRECAQVNGDRLTANLNRLNKKFHVVVGQAADRLDDVLRWHWWSCVRAVGRTLDDVAGHIGALQKCKSWKPSDCEAPEEIGSKSRGQSPLHRCLAPIGRMQARLDEEIAEGRRSLQLFGLASDGRPTHKAEMTQCVALPQAGGD